MLTTHDKYKIAKNKKVIFKKVISSTGENSVWQAEL